MAKKGKKDKRKKPAFDGPGDLRAVRHHVEEWRKRGNEEALGVLMMLGRDASFSVCAIADEWNDDELRDFGRRLVAVAPEVETNLLALRLASVSAHVNRAKSSARPAMDAELEIGGGAIALFDPMKVAGDLAGGGRPRKDAARMERGDIAWFGLPSPVPARVRFVVEAPPEPTLVLRLGVESGIVFCGPPEASDGPRFGSVRRDPERTELDARIAAGGFLRVKPGLYRVAPALDDGGVTVWMWPDPDPSAALGVDPLSVSLRSARAAADPHSTLDGEAEPG